MMVVLKDNMLVVALVERKEAKLVYMLVVG
jgi:hypothetical protein